MQGVGVLGKGQGVFGWTHQVATCALTGLMLLGLLGSVNARAAPGDVDPSFGASGVVETPQVLRQGYLRETALGMAIGPQDEIFVLGALSRACPQECPLDLEVTRYGSDGSRDDSFGAGGRAVVTVRPGQNLRVAASIAVDPNGRVVIASTHESDITLFRLTPGGALDTDFAGAGVVSSHLPEPDQAAGVAVQRDGAVVVAGARETFVEGTQALLARYTPTGDLDGGFGEGGFRVLGFVPDGYPAGLALLGKGRAAVGLSNCCDATGRAFVARLTAPGSLDHGFFRQGWRSIGRFAPVRLATIMPARRGRILAVVISRSGVFAARFLSDGRFDQRFGKRGVVFPRLSGPRREFSSVAVDDAGRILFASMGGSPREFGLARLRSDGFLDYTFAGGAAGGIPAISRAQSVALQSSGRIVVLGESGDCARTCPPVSLVLARYLGGNSGARCGGRQATVVGTRQRETLEGTPHRDVIQGLGGKDWINGYGGNDLICGGQGDDVLRGGKGRDRLLGGPGVDSRHQ